MTDHSPRAVEPSILEQLGITEPDATAPVVPSSRREARASERLAAPVKRGKSPKAPRAPKAARPPKGPKRSRSAERRIRDVQKTYAAPRRSARTGASVRTIGSKVLSVAAMLFAGALAVGMSVPANAFNAGGTTLAGASAEAATSMSAKVDGQTLDVASTVTTSSTARDEFSVTSWAQMLQLQYGTRSYAYSMGDPNGPIRWPFPYEVPISSGFGGRAAPCNGCSSMHMGLDFTPGEGAPIYAIADGVVKIHDDDAGGYGNHVYIDHGNLLGDGSNIESLYAHMQAGSSALKVGDTIAVGDFIGLVGRTGTATGNHLHFEVLVNGVQVDPFAWLKANT